jgi:hypothetical protein
MKPRAQHDPNSSFPFQRTTKVKMLSMMEKTAFIVGIRPSAIRERKDAAD